jgi:CxxC-x17-CxxC domain-containing protein
MKDLGVEPPKYFEGIVIGSFANDLNHFNSTMVSGLTSSPSGNSSWSGGSGFSGGGSSGGGFGGGGDRGGFGGNRGRDNRGGDRRGGGDREMFKTVCSECGKPCEVPFRPVSGKPVFCNECFAGKGNIVPNRFPEREGGDSRFAGKRENSAPSFGGNKLEGKIEALGVKLDKISSMLEKMISGGDVLKKESKEGTLGEAVLSAMPEKKSDNKKDSKEEKVKTKTKSKTVKKSKK